MPNRVGEFTKGNQVRHDTLVRGMVHPELGSGSLFSVIDSLCPNFGSLLRMTFLVFTGLLESLFFYQFIIPLIYIFLPGSIVIEPRLVAR